MRVPVEDLLALQTTLAHALGGMAHALIDVSDRQVGLRVGGPLAADVLNAGCPLDLDIEAFPIGMCTRTMIGRAGIILWRTGEAEFHVEVERSYVANVHTALTRAADALGSL